MAVEQTACPTFSERSESSDTVREFGGPDTVTGLIAARVEASPEATAVVDANGPVNYRELDRRASTVAARLAGAGIRPGAVVGVALERSVTMVAAWLGVLKAGASYLPLDPSHPVSRLRFMLEDTGAGLLLGTDETCAAIGGSGTPTLAMDGERWPLEQGPEEAAAVAASAPVRPHDPAYTIYTSGSTGTPKGAVIEHRNIANTLRWHVDEMGVSPGDRVGQTAAGSFDVASWEIWANLIAGAELHIAPEAVRRVPEELCRWVVERRLGFVCLITPVAALAIQHGWLQGSSLKVLMTGGEKLNAAPPADATYRCVNLYGPTETSVIATCAWVRNGERGAPPIGRPIANTVAHVLDTERRPVPVGTPGELYIGGAGVGRGYLGRPELTAERFIADPVYPGGRVYRTGDTVRRRPDGQLEFLGRVDGQLKVNGYRIESGEVEARLRAHPAVRDAAVTVWRPRAGHPRLAGYVAGEAGLDGADVRGWLAGRLPAHMVPAVIVPLKELPLTEHQKVDRDALPDPGSLLEAADGEGAGGDGPEPWPDASLAALAEDWRAACGVRARASEDTLVSLGAGSLDLVALRVRLLEHRRLTVPSELLTLDQTLAEQARLVAGLAPKDRTGNAPGGATEGFGSLGQEAIVFLEEAAGTGMGYQYQAVLEGPGAPDTAVLERALLAVLRSQSALACRWRMTPRGLEGRHVDLDGLPLKVHTVDTAGVDDLIAELVDRPIGYDDFPLIGWDLVRHPDGTVLLQREHHLIHDGWSVGVLLRLLQDAYRTLEQGLEWTPDDGAMTYFDWAAAQRERGRGPAGEEARAFWREHLAGAPVGRAEVPWRTSPELSGLSAEVSVLRLKGRRSARLREQSARIGVTPFSFLLACFRRLACEVQGVDQCVIGSGFANRDAATRDIVGCFVNVLPLRGGGAVPTAADAARAEMELIAEAGRHQWLPTAEIVRTVAPGQGLSHTPLYQIMFSQHDAPLPEVRLGEWRPWVRELSNGRGKTDLSVIVMNRDLQHARASARRDTGDYALRWEHDPALYPREVIASLQQRFTRLLDRALADPHRALSDAG
ncbi:amino acid adenylation domain-containing protein [Nocardiopsis sp. NPDC049922]|uniref:non-ribosomal peptide synthetase n=1 Tax=Nocardiopsis sp. NPDC049922 TaxID=3155157 RepID=UPI003409E95B